MHTSYELIDSIESEKHLLVGKLVESNDSVVDGDDIIVRSTMGVLGCRGVGLRELVILMTVEDLTKSELLVALSGEREASVAV